MDLTTQNETPEQAVMNVLAATNGGNTSPLTLHRILGGEAGGYSAPAISNALLTLNRKGLIEQEPGGHGWYRLTKAGQVYANQGLMPDPLKEVIAHPGGRALDMLAGSLALGRDARGEEAYCFLWNSEGTVPFLVTGSTGSGSTETLAGMIQAALPHYPGVRVWMIDPIGQLRSYWDQVEKVGVCGDAWRDDRKASRAEDLLDQVLAVQRDRHRFLAQSGLRTLKSFDVPYFPLGILILDDLGEIMRDYRLREKLNRICKTARKTGIVVAASASSSRLQEFGGDMAIQDYFATGTVLTLRFSTPLFGRMVTKKMEDFEPIPAQFEDGSTTAGVGYLTDGTRIRTYLASGL